MNKHRQDQKKKKEKETLCSISFHVTKQDSAWRFLIPRITLISFLQLKSSLQLHIDGTSAVAEDIGRQVGFIAPDGQVNAA